MVWLLWNGDFKVVVNGNGGAALAAVDQLGRSGECEKAPTRCPIRSGEEFNRNYPLAWNNAIIAQNLLAFAPLPKRIPKEFSVWHLTNILFSYFIS